MTEPEQVHPPQDDAPREPKIIKRYTNRKLYDTVESRYVTLDEIAEMIKQGAEVKIVDNRSKDDLLRAGQRTFEDLQRRADERVKSLVENVVGNLPALGADLTQLTQRLSELERRIDELERKKSSGTSGTGS